MAADKEKVEEQEEAIAAASEALTEKRVTRRVIRRRRSSDSDPADAKVEAAADEKAPEPEAEESSQSSDEKTEVSRAVKRKLAAKATEAPRGLKKVEPKIETQPSRIVSKPEPKPESEKKKEPAGVGDKYSQIKVVGTLPKEEPKPASDSRPKIGGRKEVIEIRRTQRPNNKMGMRRNQKRRLPPGKEGKKTEITTPKAVKRIIRMSDSITVSELAKNMSMKVGDLIGRLMSMGMVVTLNQNIDVDTATLVASEFGFEIENVSVVAEDLLEAQEKQYETKPEDLKLRPPVVTVMGHVDHGKTTLLDRIRKADVASGEAGGITQHIGAYSVKMEDGKSVTFIDTPGHEAFTSMRARGAKVTDIVILVVAADDGIMPQTREAINHAQSAEVPIIVAINKIDKPGVDQDRIKKELTEFNMVPEEWGGDTIYAPVSALKGDGVPELLEFLALQSEVLELKANPDRPAKGVILEASLDKRRGVISTVLIQEGTLKEGHTIVAGTHVGRVRAMKDDKGRAVKEAGPSKAVELIGLPGVASAGDLFSAVPDEKKAKHISELKTNQERQKELAKTSKVSLDDLYKQIAKGDVKELKIVVKADTAGSVEVLTKTLEDLSTEKVTVKVIHGAVGGVSENDIMLASASGALVVAFHVRPGGNERKLAEQNDVEVRAYEVIYELTADVTKAMTGLLEAKKVEKVVGQAEVRETFAVPKMGTIAGCYMTSGKIQRSSKVRLIREAVPVYTGDLKSLKRFKDDVREVTEGLECGMGIENFNDIKVGDVIEAFEIEEQQASLD